MQARLIEPHAELTEQLVSFLVICPQVLDELFRRPMHRVVCQTAQPRCNPRIAYRLAEFGVERTSTLSSAKESSSKSLCNLLIIIYYIYL